MRRDRPLDVIPPAQGRHWIATAILQEVIKASQNANFDMRLFCARDHAMLFVSRLLTAILTLGILADEGLGEVGKDANRVSSKPYTVDLLALVEPSRDGIKGKVDTEAGALSIESQWFLAAIRLPYVPSNRYDLELELNRIEGRDGIGIILPVAEQRQVALVLGGYPDKGGLDGLNYIDGRNLAENGTGEASCLQNNEKITVIVSVRSDRIGYRYPCRSAAIEAIHEIGARDLSIDERAGEVRQRGLALYQVKGASRFTRIVLKDYGQGRVLTAWAD